MPLVTTALAAYLAGLYAGFATLVAPVLAIAGAGLAEAFRRRSLLVAGLCASLLAGLAAARSVVTAERRCETALRVADTWRLRLTVDAVPGRSVRAESVECRARVLVSVERGRAPRDAIVEARGIAVAPRGAMVLEDARLSMVAAPSWRARWLARAERAVDAVFRADAPLARALLVADARRIPVEVRDRFAAAGLVHVLSISGLHVGIIALALEIVFGALRLGRTASTLSALGVTAVYVVVIGAPAPAVRAALMLAVHGASRIMQRPTSPWAILTLGGAAPVLEPRVALDLGWQLSVVGVAALCAVPGVADRVIPDAIRGRRREVLVALLASTVATALTAPLVAWRFGQVSLAGPVVNLVASPVVALLQPTLFLALLLAPVAPVARFVADAAHPLLAALDFIAAAGAALPFARLVVAPAPIDAALAAAAIVALVAAMSDWHAARCLFVAASCAAAVVWRPLLAPGNGYVELHAIDVGQGDALALRTASGRWVLFDAGGAWSSGDAGRSRVVPYIARRGGRVSAFVLSHPHTDHVGGAASVLRSLEPQVYLDAAFAAGNRAYAGSLLTAREMRVAWRRVHPGDSLVVDGVVLTVLAPDSAWTASLTDPNLASAIVLVRAGSRRFLLVGDAERAEEEWVLRRAAADLRADVLKVGHHGSRTSSSAPFLDAVRPRIALVSVGAMNLYGHPDASVLAALRARGAQVLRTDLHGSIVVRTDGRRLWAEADGVTWEVP